MATLQFRFYRAEGQTLKPDSIVDVPQAVSWATLAFLMEYKRKTGCTHVGIKQNGKGEAIQSLYGQGRLH